MKDRYQREYDKLKLIYERDNKELECLKIKCDLFEQMERSSRSTERYTSEYCDKLGESVDGLNRIGNWKRRLTSTSLRTQIIEFVDETSKLARDCNMRYRIHMRDTNGYFNSGKVKELNNNMSGLSHDIRFYKDRMDSLKKLIDALEIEIKTVTYKEDRKDIVQMVETIEQKGV
jgi:hypothetical protein